MTVDPVERAVSAMYRIAEFNPESQRETINTDLEIVRRWGKTAQWFASFRCCCCWHNQFIEYKETTNLRRVRDSLKRAMKDIMTSPRWEDAELRGKCEAANRVFNTFVGGRSEGKPVAKREQYAEEDKIEPITFALSDIEKQLRAEGKLSTLSLETAEKPEDARSPRTPERYPSLKPKDPSGKTPPHTPSSSEGSEKTPLRSTEAPPRKEEPFATDKPLDDKKQVEKGPSLSSVVPEEVAKKEKEKEAVEPPKVPEKKELLQRDEEVVELLKQEHTLTSPPQEKPKEKDVQATDFTPPRKKIDSEDEERKVREEKKSPHSSERSDSLEEQIRKSAAVRKEEEKRKIEEEGSTQPTKPEEKSTFKSPDSVMLTRSASRRRQHHRT